MCTYTGSWHRRPACAYISYFFCLDECQMANAECRFVCRGLDTRYPDAFFRAPNSQTFPLRSPCRTPPRGTPSLLTYSSYRSRARLFAESNDPAPSSFGGAFSIGARDSGARSTTAGPLAGITGALAGIVGAGGVALATSA